MLRIQLPRSPQTGLTLGPRWLESFSTLQPAVSTDRDEVDRIPHQPLRPEGADRDSREKLECQLVLETSGPMTKVQSSTRWVRCRLVMEGKTPSAAQCSTRAPSSRVPGHALAGGQTESQLRPRARCGVRTWEALADGVLDAAVLARAWSASGFSWDGERSQTGSIARWARCMPACRRWARAGDKALVLQATTFRWLTLP